MCTISNSKKCVYSICYNVVIKVMNYLPPKKQKHNLKTQTKKKIFHTIKKKIKNTRRSSRVKIQPKFFHEEYNY